MNKIFHELCRNGVSIYLYDILIYTKNRADHIKLVDKVIEQLKIAKIQQNYQVYT